MTGLRTENDIIDEDGDIQKTRGYLPVIDVIRASGWRFARGKPGRWNTNRAVGMKYPSETRFSKQNRCGGEISNPIIGGRTQSEVAPCNQ